MPITQIVSGVWQINLAAVNAFVIDELGLQSLGRLAALDFDVACFGHGRAIRRGASERFREKWGAVSRQAQLATSGL